MRYFFAYNQVLIFCESRVNVIVLIGVGIFGAKDANGKLLSASKDHWVVWNSKITLLNGSQITDEATPLTEIVKLEAFSWGTVKTNYIRSGLTLAGVLEYIFGGFVVKKIL
ncbi:hypothetical protein [Orbus mooreae]|uniref:hypothetical protein n=1 Tax=Orbus mooreae TaxID=3074107 RepID=UPI00370DB17B